MPARRNIINIIKLLQDNSKFFELTQNHITLALQLSTNFSLAIIKLASEIVRHNIDDIQEGTLTRLLGGARERRDREALFDEVAKIVQDNRLSPIPAFYPDLVELVARLINATSDSSKITSCLDHHTRSYVSPDVDLVYGKPEDTYGSRTLKLSRDVILFLIKHTGISKQLFAHILSEDSLPSSG